VSESDLDRVVLEENMLASQRDRLGGDLEVIAHVERDIIATKQLLRRDSTSVLHQMFLDRLEARLKHYKESLG